MKVVCGSLVYAAFTP
ncbi:hypothetical protein M2G59_21385 [Vibrio vulnificus]|nr:MULTISPECIES: hypothetical protein [Vibrio]MCU8129012.1 hypothetical protein [Vibrio vulnificus]MCU8154950.1 hypothetical protein [Vibrio vulnificus]MCU8221378.1 hypothetical protein [Vibrio vulnificus]MCU8242956.1 hypothetical protein [Vibrio vulnificus]MCU8282534.1 hypothetical protein [Vibrio vulnificus]